MAHYEFLTGARLLPIAFSTKHCTWGNDVFPDSLNSDLLLSGWSRYHRINGYNLIPAARTAKNICSVKWELYNRNNSKPIGLQSEK